MLANADSQGRCVRHPFVQLQRLSRRTGERKAPRDGCALCVLDVQPRRTCRVWFGDVEGTDKAGLERQRQPPSGSLTGLSCNGGIITVSGGMCSSSQSVVSCSSVASQQTKSVLKAPRYKACKEKMRIQAGQIKKVTTMSMHLSIDRDEDEDDNEEEKGIGIEKMCFCQPCSDPEDKEVSDKVPERRASEGSNKRSIALCQDDASQERKASSDSVSEEEWSRATGSSGTTGKAGSSGVTQFRRNRRSTRHQTPSLRTRDNSSNSSRRHRSSKHGGHPRQQEKMSSSSLQVTCQVRPDPEVTGSVASTRASMDDSGPEASRPQRRQGLSSHRQRQQANEVASSFSSSDPDQFRQACPPPPPPPPSLHPNLMMGNINNLSLQVLFGDEASTLSFMGIDPNPNNDDEVSTLMDNSVHTLENQFLPNPKHSCSECQDDEEKGVEPPVANSMINTDDFDNRGRCRRHPHIKLRKKNLFGKGWKVFMSCPHCCVDKIRSMRMMEKGNKKRMKQKIDRNEGGSEDWSQDEHCAASGPRGLSSNESRHQPQEKPQYQLSPPSCPLPKKQASSSHCMGSDKKCPSLVSPKMPADDRSREETSAASGLYSLAGNGIQHQSQSQYQPPPPSCLTPQKHVLGRNGNQSSGPGPPRFTKMPTAVPPPPPRTGRTQKRPPVPDAYIKRPTPQDGRREDPVPPTRQSPCREAPTWLANAHAQGPSDGDSATASLTSDEPVVDGDRSRSPQEAPVPERAGTSQRRNLSKAAPAVLEGKTEKEKSWGKSKDPRQEAPSLPRQPRQRGTICLRLMRWTDAKGSGTSTVPMPAGVELKNHRARMA